MFGCLHRAPLRDRLGAGGGEVWALSCCRAGAMSGRQQGYKGLGLSVEWGAIVFNGTRVLFMERFDIFDQNDSNKNAAQFLELSGFQVGARGRNRTGTPCGGGF